MTIEDVGEFGNHRLLFLSKLVNCIASRVRRSNRQMRAEMGFLHYS